MEEMMKNTNRSKQFMPFASLKGYYDLILEREKTIEIKKQLTNEMKENLSRIIISLRRSDFVKIKFYENTGYEIKEGLITDINFDLKIIKVLKKQIKFEDIFSIEKLQ